MNTKIDAKVLKLIILSVAGILAGIVGFKQLKPLLEKNETTAKFGDWLILAAGLFAAMQNNEHIKNAGKGGVILGLLGIINKFVADKPEMQKFIPQISGVGDADYAQVNNLLGTSYIDQNGYLLGIGATDYSESLEQEFSGVSGNSDAASLLM